LNTGLTIYRPILIITLFLICTVNVCFLIVNPDSLIVTKNQISVIETLHKSEANLELKSNDYRSTSNGLQVEIFSIPGPVSFDSGYDHMSDLNLLIKIYSKKRYSLISHSDLIISKTLHISPLITKLQI